MSLALPFADRVEQLRVVFQPYLDRAVAKAREGNHNDVTAMVGAISRFMQYSAAAAAPPHNNPINLGRWLRDPSTPYEAGDPHLWGWSDVQAILVRRPGESSYQARITHFVNVMGGDIIAGTEAYSATGLKDLPAVMHLFLEAAHDVFRQCLPDDTADGYFDEWRLKWADRLDPPSGPSPLYDKAAGNA